MATNFLSRFAALASTSYTSGKGLRYTDEYWQSSADSIREAGFLANSPISSIQMNTILSQTSMVAYIIGEVLASNIIKDSSGIQTLTQNIDSTTSDANIESYYITPFINFLNRINDISGNGGTGTESVWRSRQLSNSDTSNPYWWVDGDGVLQKSGNQSVPQIYVGILQSSSTSDANIRLTDGVITLTGNSSAVVGPLSVSGTLSANGTLQANKGINCGGTVQIGARAPIIMGSLSSPSQLQLWARYNQKGETTDDYQEEAQNLETILFNIGQRLDNLGFDKGSVTPGTATTGTVNVTTNWIYRQGNYVIGHFTASMGSGAGGFRQGNTIFTIPSGFLPKSQFTMMAGGEGSQTGSTAYGRYTLTFNTTGEVVGTNASFNGVIRSIDIQFGYEALPRSSQSL